MRAQIGAGATFSGYAPTTRAGNASGLLNPYNACVLNAGRAKGQILGNTCGFPDARLSGKSSTG
jgi:hypothetical protein